MLFGLLPDFPKIKIPDDWTEERKFSISKILKGLFGYHRFSTKTKSNYFPIGFIGGAIDTHENFHIVTERSKDHGFPPYCIMNGTVKGDGWKEKNPFNLIKVCYHARKRNDWFCEDCREHLDEAMKEDN